MGSPSGMRTRWFSSRFGERHVSVNGCSYSCSLTSQSNASYDFPITENSC
ncbi:hypothetical protein SNL152K_3155 [Streptomyces sp. NL15-2K]|nr:hypothetical protein SNL152K_3155 [Streptomyces sp. NL15-2K]